MAAFFRRIGELSYQDLIKFVVRALVILWLITTIISFGAWLLGEIQFERPFLEWSASFLEWVDGYAQNLGTEMVGALVTFFLIDQILGEKQRQ